MCKASPLNHQDFGSQVGFSQTAPERPITREKLVSESPEPRDDATWGLLGCRRELGSSGDRSCHRVSHIRGKRGGVSAAKNEKISNHPAFWFVWWFQGLLFFWFLFLVVHFRVSAPAPARRLTHNLLTHIDHTQLVHTQLTHTHTTWPHTSCILSPHNLTTHNLLTHTQLGQTHLDHTHLASCHHTTWPHTTCHHTTCSHTTCPHTHTGVALGDICLHFAWQAWHLAKSAFTLRGRCGTSRHRPPLCVVGVALMPLGWLWWRAWFPVWRRGRRGSLRGKRGIWRHFAWRRSRRGSLRGRRDTWRHLPSLCVAGVALGDIDLHFAWHACGLATSTSTLRGKRGTYATGSGGALGSEWTRLFAWQAWHLATSAFTLRGRRGTYGTGLALVARLGLHRTPLSMRLSAWQAWHLVTSTVVLRGMRGTWWPRPSLCVAGVALGDIDRHFA